MAESNEGVYEMLWDCRSCGTRKLLGKTQRYCPNCGAGQDPATRYFPSDEDKIAVADHEYVGADRLCGYCKAAQSANAKCCTNCGGPLDRTKEAAIRADQVRDEGQAFAGETAADARREHQSQGKPPAPPPRTATHLRWWHYAILAGTIGAIAIAVGIFWRGAHGFAVNAHRWDRVVHVEQYGPQPDTAWCDSVPLGAYRLTRSQEVKSHDKVQEGEDCKMRRKDSGDGTFKQVKECTPHMVDKPVYAERCHYVVDRWAASRELKSTGGLGDAPTWPIVNLREGNCVGCEREANRGETYTVVLRDEKSGKLHECSFPQARWSEMKEGAKFSGETGVLLDDLRCDSLKGK